MQTASDIYSQVLAQNSLDDFYSQMLDATPDCIKVISVDGNLITMNQAGCVALGVTQGTAFGTRWLSLLPPDVHQAGEAALAKAAGGQSARFPGKSVSPDGVMYWDNLLTPVTDDSGRVTSILCVSRDVTEKTLLEARLNDAVERETLLAREMRHRVKNLFSVVAGLAAISKREARAAGDLALASDILTSKLHALSRASDAVFAHDASASCDKSPVDLQVVVASVLQPYGNRCEYTGASGWIRRSDVTTLPLLLHELATNSVKYGALSCAAGRVILSGATTGEGLHLTWREKGGPLVSGQPGRSGFGTEMMNRVIQSAGGGITRSWPPEGLVVELNLPGFEVQAPL